MGRFPLVSNGEFRLAVPTFLPGRKSVLSIRDLVANFDAFLEELGQAVIGFLFV